MPTVNVGPAGVPTLREAINGAASGDTIALADGIYASITSLAKQTSIKPGPAPGSGYVIDGTSRASTIIEDTRIYQYNTDGPYSPGIVQDLTLSYGPSSPINGSYLLNVREGSWTIQNVGFTGTLTGSAGSSGAYMFCRGGNPPGPYKAANVTLDDIVVDLLGQIGFNGATGEGGSSFIQSFFNSGSIVIKDSVFDERGFRNSFTILSTGSASITGNTFKRTTNQNVRSEGETIIDTQATVADNIFSDGAYLQLGYVGNTSSKAVTVIGNTFNTINEGVGLVLVQGSASPTVTGNAFRGDGTAFRYISSAVGSRRIGTGGANTVEINGTDLTFSSLTSGGQNSDNINGTASEDWINGDDGNDTINGRAGNDYILGGTGNDTLNGGRGIDTLVGGDGDDTLTGAAGADILTGGFGADGFTYRSRNQGKDTITDFSSAEGDTLRFRSGAFGGISTVTLGSNFFINTTGDATGAGPQFIYNTTSGMLAYDRNGASSGGSFNMAILTGIPTLTAADIVMF